MNTPAPPSRPLEALRELTPARVGLGRSGPGMPTEALLAFTLDHARARDAVHAAFDAKHLVDGLAGLGFEVSAVSSQAPERRLEWVAALSVTMVVCAVVLVMAERIQRVLGDRVVMAFERLMGLILVAISVEMMIRGLKVLVKQL